MMQSDQLHRLISRLDSFRTDGNLSDEALVALSRSALKLYNASCFNVLEHADVKRAGVRLENLCRECLARAVRTKDSRSKARLVFMVGQLIFGRCSGPLGQKQTAAYASLVKEFIGSILSDPEKVRTMDDNLAFLLMLCISDYLYFVPECSDTAEKAGAFFDRQLLSWVCSQKSNGVWEGVSCRTVCKRLIILDRNSSMFLDHSYDENIIKAFGYYAESDWMAKMLHSSENSILHLHLLGYWQQLCAESALLAADKMAFRIRQLLVRQFHSCMEGTEEWFYSSIYTIEEYCTGLEHEIRKQLAADITFS